MADCYPATPCDFGDPFLVGCVWLEVLSVSDDANASCMQYIGELSSKIAVSEVDARVCGLMLLARTPPPLRPLRSLSRSRLQYSGPSRPRRFGRLSPVSKWRAGR